MGTLHHGIFHNVHARHTSWHLHTSQAVVKSCGSSQWRVAGANSSRHDKKEGGIRLNNICLFAVDVMSKNYGKLADLEVAGWIGTVKGKVLVKRDSLTQVARLWHRLFRCLFEQGDTCEEWGMRRAHTDFLFQWPVKLTRQGRIDGTSTLVVGNST